MKKSPTKTRFSAPWLWVLALVTLQFAAWTAWFIIAAHHPVVDVPLAVTR